MTTTALGIAIATSSVSAMFLGAIARWLYRIDRKTSQNHRALFEDPNLVEMAQHNRERLIRENKLDPSNSD